MARRPQSTFTAQVDDWVRASENRMDAVFKESAQRVAHLASVPVGDGGNMPVDTGTLRASLQATVNQPNNNVTLRGEGRAEFDAGQLALVIAGAKLGDTIYLTWTANYALYVEVGAGGRPARAFARSAAKQWGAIVQEVAFELRTRVMGG